MSGKDKIEGSRCNTCGFIQHVSHLRCLRCKSDSFSREFTSNTCTLLSFTILKAPPMEFRNQKSYTLGMVEFENGMRAVGQIHAQDDPKIGMVLKTAYKKICDNLDNNEVYAHVFESID